MRFKKLLLVGAVAASLMASTITTYAMPADVGNEDLGNADEDDNIGASAGWDDTGDDADDHIGASAGWDDTGDYDSDDNSGSSGKYNPDDYLQTIDVMMTATATVNMRTSPNGTIIGSLEKGKDIHVVGNQTDVCWYRCETSDGQIVYIYDDYLLPDFPETLTATHNVYVRTGASTSYDAVGVLQVGDTIKASAVDDGWIEFTYEKTGQAGYVYAAYVAVR